MITYKICPPTLAPPPPACPPHYCSGLISYPSHPRSLCSSLTGLLTALQIYQEGSPPRVFALASPLVGMLISWIPAWPVPSEAVCPEVNLTTLFITITPFPDLTSDITDLPHDALLLFFCNISHLPTPDNIGLLCVVYLFPLRCKYHRSSIFIIFVHCWILRTENGTWHVARLSKASQMALVVKNLPANAGDKTDSGSIPGSGRSPGGGHGNPFRYSCLENPHGQRSLASYSPWGHKELDMTEVI